MEQDYSRKPFYDDDFYKYFNVNKKGISYTNYNKYLQTKKKENVPQSKHKMAKDIMEMMALFKKTYGDMPHDEKEQKEEDNNVGLVRKAQYNYLKELNKYTSF